jgi:guanine deaminase
MPERASHTVIRNGVVVDPARRGNAAVAAADLLLAGDRIVEIGPPGLAAPADAVPLDASDRILMPGLVNAHTHGHGPLSRGIGDRWTLELLLNAGPWLAGNRALEHKYLAALLGAVEMVSKGCTACYDLYFEFPAPTRDGIAAVAKAYADVGMRAVVAPMIADQTFYRALPGLLEALPEKERLKMAAVALQPYPKTLATCAEIFAGWTFDRERVRPAIAPTIPLHCSDDFLTGCRDLAREHGIGLHTHLAESKAQSIAGVARYGHTLTAHLESLGLLGPEFTAAHGVWLDEEDLRRLTGAGASLAHNPGSNMRLGSGLAPAWEARAAGLNVGIGTDSASCSDNQNMFEAMRLASFASRVRSHDYEEWLSTEAVLAMATAGSARALGFGEAIGRLAPGAKADIVFLDAGHSNYVPLNDAVNQIVHAEDATGVAEVMIGGRMVYRDGKVAGFERAGLRARAEAAVAELAVRNAEARAFAEGLSHAVGRFCVGLSRQPYHVHSLAGSDY